MQNPMQTKQFHLGDVLSVIAHTVLPPRGVEGTCDILRFMTNDSPFSHAIFRMCGECKPYLIEQFPKLGSPEVASAIAELRATLESADEQTEEGKLATDWLAVQVAKYGEMLSVRPIPPGQYQGKNEIAELEKIMGGPKKVIMLHISDDPSHPIHLYESLVAGTR